MRVPVAEGFSLMASGVVNPVDKFLDDAEKAQLAEARKVNPQAGRPQALNDQGTPLWEVEVLATVHAYGKDKTEVIAIRVASQSRPVVQSGAVQFSGLTHDYRERRGGGAYDVFEATGVRNTTGRHEDKAA